MCISVITRPNTFDLKTTTESKILETNSRVTTLLA